MPDSTLIREFALQGEGRPLTSKETVLFVGATEKQQSELLKDILAFTARGGRRQHTFS